MAAELERKGLLARERDPGNRRLYRLRLTDHRRTLHASMAPAFHQRYVRWVVAMTPAERDALLVGLSAFVPVLREGPAPAECPRSSAWDRRRVGDVPPCDRRG